MKPYAKTDLTLLMTALMGSMWLGGCQKPPATTTQDVLDYIRNAEAGAAVRRLDDEAQDYVERVMGAYGAYNKACKPVADLSKRKALWPLADAKWRDVEKVAKLRETLKRWQVDAPDPAKPGTKTRAQALNELNEAITRIPVLPDADPTTNSRMITDIKSRLMADDTSSKYVEIARAYLELLTAATDHADDFDPKATGLTFQNATLSARVASTWQELHDMIVEPLEQVLADTTNRIARDEKLRSEALTEKQAIRSAITADRDKLRRYRELELLVEYYDARLKAAEKREKELEKEASERSATQEKPAAAHP